MDVQSYAFRIRPDLLSTGDVEMLVDHGIGQIILMDGVVLSWGIGALFYGCWNVCQQEESSALFGKDLS